MQSQGSELLWQNLPVYQGMKEQTVILLSAKRLEVKAVFLGNLILVSVIHTCYAHEPIYTAPRPWVSRGLSHDAVAANKSSSVFLPHIPSAFLYFQPLWVNITAVKWANLY